MWFKFCDKFSHGRNLLDFEQKVITSYFIKFQ